LTLKVIKEKFMGSSYDIVPEPEIPSFPTGVVPVTPKKEITNGQIFFGPGNTAPTIVHQPMIVGDTYLDRRIGTERELVAPPSKHAHYFKDVSKLSTIDVYRVIELFKIGDPCIQHAIKKLLVAGGRGAGKDINKDIQESIDSLERWKEMRKEDNV
jgi:hypothetical protein